jgi:hypothetical protein
VKGSQLAMKRITFEDLEEANSAIEELMCINKLNHQNIVEYLDLYLNESDSLFR